jgi:hypothetical protein
MPWYIYSHEPLPNLAFMGRPGYTPDSEYIRYGGIALPAIPKRKWMKLDDSFTTLHRRDWRDKQGTEVEIPVRKFKAVVEGRFLERGVIMIDHEPNDAEKQELKKISEDLNLSWRRQCIQAYEDQVAEKNTTGHGRSKPTPYEDECFEILGMVKPYSVESLQSQRDPGRQAAERIAEALEKITRKEAKDNTVEIEEAVKRVMAAKEAKPEALAPKR